MYYPLMARMILALMLFVFPYAAVAQAPTQPNSSDAILTQAMKLSVLALGHTPFHTTLAVTGPSPQYTASLELWWLAPNQYRLKIASPSFSQLRVVDNDRVSEVNQGDFMPRWIENFVSALLVPLDPTQFSSQAGAEVPQLPTLPNGLHAVPCFRRDDRPGGITNQLTWGIVCFYEGGVPHLRSIDTFTKFLEFKDFHNFNDQDIPYTIETGVLDYKPVVAHRTLLEELVKPDLSLFTVDHTTPTAERIQTTFVSTLKEESLIDHPPVFDWPPVGGGKPEGYMIVYARTDRTGQVRETAKHNSDNSGVEQFGMEHALTLKFNPLIVDGVPQQMEMPLVLHFKSQLVADPTPTLNDEQTRSHISGCSLPKAKPGKPPFRVRVSVNEEGKLAGETYLDANTPNAPHQSSVPGLSLRACKFSPLVVDGKPTYYHGDLLLP